MHQVEPGVEQHGDQHAAPGAEEQGMESCDRPHHEDRHDDQDRVPARPDSPPLLLDTVASLAIWFAERLSPDRAHGIRGVQVVVDDPQGSQGSHGSLLMIAINL
jgi:hypothetical protein